MFALRSVLVIDALDADALIRARRTSADAVMIDLAAPALHGRRGEARASAAKHLKAIARAGRPVVMRVSDTRSGEMERDLEAVVSPALAAVVLPGAEVPQDVRDADVQIRKREMRTRVEPGAVRLVPTVDSAEGLLTLVRSLEAVDRHGAVMLDVEGLRSDLRLGERAAHLYDHAMAEVAVAADATRLPWLLHIERHRPESASLPARAHDFGAGGVTVHSEAETRGINALFTPDPLEVAIARATLAEWGRVRKRGEWAGVVAGEVVEAPGYDRLVDRRTVRRARALVALAAAIEARESVE